MVTDSICVTASEYEGVYFMKSTSKMFNGEPDVCYLVNFNLNGKSVWQEAGWKSAGVTEEIAHGYMINYRSNEQDKKYYVVGMNFLWGLIFFYCFPTSLDVALNVFRQSMNQVCVLADFIVAFIVMTIVVKYLYNKINKIKGCPINVQKQAGISLKLLNGVAQLFIYFAGYFCGVWIGEHSLIAFASFLGLGFGAYKLQSFEQ